MCVCFQIFSSLCLCLCLFLCISLPSSVSLCSPLSCSLCLYLSISPCVSVPVCLRLSCSLFSSKPGVTQKALTVHYRENIEQSLFAHARSSTAGANNEKFRINWVLIICQGKKLRDIYETKDNLATVKTSARSNKSNPNEA